MRASASRRLVRLGDIIASIALVASLSSGDRCVVRGMRCSNPGHAAWEHYGYGRGQYARSVPIWSRQDEPPSVGRVLWQLALAEETFFTLHYRYAPHAGSLDIALPAGWNVTVLAGSQRRYQVRLNVTVGPERGVSCLLWGNRVAGRPLDEFQVNCVDVTDSRGRA